MIARETVGLGRIALDGDDTYWAELRPWEQGRNIIVRRTPDGGTTDVTPPTFSVGTRVHEYGTRGYTVVDGVIYFAHFDDQRLYRHRPGEDPEPITPAAAYRYAGMVVDRARRRIVCIREDHTVEGAEPDNVLVALDLDGSSDAQVLASSHDFYGATRIRADGTALAWVGWDHPNMPWDGSRLWAASVEPDGRLGAPTLVAGGVSEAIAQPEWAPDGTLYFLSDRSGWWNLYRWRNGAVEPVVEMEAEFAKTYWWVGMSSYGFDSPESLICTYGRHGVWRMARVDLSSKRLEPIDIPYSALGWGDLQVASGRVVFGAASPTKPMSMLELDLKTGRMSVLQVALNAEVDPGYLSMPVPVEYPTENGLTAHAFYYAPANRDYRGPDGERPPLLVTCHGGPTGAATMALDLWTQFWTSRGIAVLDVNYGGSTGYGRDYRERLIGEWGVVDVDDSVNGARYLVARGSVDAERLVISGGSAGGYTALAAMTFRDLFKAGASHFGVSDLEALVVDIHKFDTHSLDGLIGPYPLFKRRYIERSPIHYVDQLTCPVIFFQGLEDTIVPADQSKAIFDVLRDRGVPTAFVAFEGEHHGFARAENIKRTLEAELYFYSRVFGFEIGDEVEPVYIENAHHLPRPGARSTQPYG